MLYIVGLDLLQQGLVYGLICLLHQPLLLFELRVTLLCTFPLCQFIDDELFAEEEKRG